jgi:hypothetical protein
MDKVNHHLIMWGNEQEGISLMNLSRMNLAKTCVFNIKKNLIGKITSILQKQFEKKPKLWVSRS